VGDGKLHKKLHLVGPPSNRPGAAIADEIAGDIAAAASAITWQDVMDNFRRFWGMHSGDKTGYLHISMCGPVDMIICAVAALQHWSILTSDKGLQRCVEVLKTEGLISQV
jgi:hypothetical protein